MLTPANAVLLLMECALGALVILLVAMGSVALGAWAGFVWVWLLLFFLYLLARLIVLEA